MSALGDTYGYYGEDDTAPRNAVLTLKSATLGDAADHAAVWLGVGTPKSWIQGGIEQTYGDKKPFAYIEAGRYGRQIHFQAWEVDYDQPVSVRLIPHLWRHWSVRVDNVVFGAIPASGRPQWMLELMGIASAAATIDGRAVEGSQKQ